MLANRCGCASSVHEPGSGPAVAPILPPVAGPDIRSQRLRNQRLTGSRLATAAEVVRWLGAVQAQDYGAAKWGIAQRVDGVTEIELDRMLEAGTLIRTHVMRPTWHFVPPEDVRWMLALTAPRVNAVSAYYHRRLELDDALFARSNAVLAGALRGGAQLTRTELARALADAGIEAAGTRLAYIVMRAELDAVIVSGGRRGKQFTYALLDERVPSAKALSRDGALAELTRRYFRSHGPARVTDYAWWSGLTVADARLGVEMAGPDLTCQVVDGKTYWRGAATSDAEVRGAVHLLASFDEYLVGYADRDHLLGPIPPSATALENALLMSALVVNGQVAGGWRRTLQGRKIILELDPLVALDRATKEAVLAVAEAYGRFAGMPHEVIAKGNSDE